MNFSKAFFDFQEELALNSDLTAIARTVLKHAIHATSGQAGLFLYLAPGAKYFQVVTIQGYPDSLVQDWQQCSPDRNLPLPIAIRLGQAIFESVQPPGKNVTAALPVGDPGFCFAGFAVSYCERSSISVEDQDFLKAVANHARTALEQLSGEGGV